MFEKNLKIAYLLDFYGNLLDERTRAVMASYYEDDLSLAEIAEDESISRQGVRHIIKKTEEQLLFLEEKLRLAEDFSIIKEQTELLGKIRDLLKARDDPELQKAAEDLSRVMETILAKAL